MNHVVGIGEYVVSNIEGDIITTFALASCVAVTLYCPIKKASGMIHIALPEPLDNNVDYNRLGYFVSTGLPLLFKTMYQTFGCRKQDLYIQIYGGANSIRPKDVFNVGKRNIEAVELILTGENLKYYLKEVGGFVSRTIEMEVATGTIKSDTQPIRI